MLLRGAGGGGGGRAAEGGAWGGIQGWLASFNPMRCSSEQLSWRAQVAAMEAAVAPRAGRMRRD